LCSCRLSFHRSGDRAPLFRAQAASGAVRLEIGRVDHDRLVLGPFGGQPHHDPGEDPVVAPALPAVIQGLGRAVFLRRIAPPQPIAIDEDYSAEDAPIIDARAAMALGK